MSENCIEVVVEIRDGGVYLIMPSGEEHYAGPYEKAVRILLGEFKD